MDKRVLLTIGISIAIVILWFRVFPPQTPEPAKPQAPVAAPAVPAQPTVAASPTAEPPPLPIAPERRIAMERMVGGKPGYRVVFSSWGGVPVEFTLLHPQYRELAWVPKGGPQPGPPPVRKGDDDPAFEHKLVPINMVRPEMGEAPFQVSFPESDFGVPPGAAWQVVQQTEREIYFALDVGTVHVEKHWKLPEDGYQIGLTVVVENRGPKPVNQHLQVKLATWQDPQVKSSSFSFGQQLNLSQAMCHVGGKLHLGTLDDLAAKPFSTVGDVKWLGTGNQFFIAALALPPGGGERRCSTRVEGAGRVVSEVVFPGQQIAPGQAVEHAMTAFIGPKLLKQLDTVRLGGVDAKLGDAVNYGMWEILARPMLWVLQQIQRLVINWGLAIIGITILLKAATYYPTARSMHSMRRMADLKPKLDALKARCGNDKNKLNQETMALYKAHNINPLGGCLPVLVQMPLYIAFYSMLSNAVELYRASFVGPIDDMTAPFWPLAAVTGALMFLQQRMTPQAVDSQQQKMMMYMMPVMFTVFTIFLPSGLTLYILTNSLLSMAQQWWFNRKYPVARKPARA